MTEGKMLLAIGMLFLMFMAGMVIGIGLGGDL